MLVRRFGLDGKVTLHDLDAGYGFTLYRVIEPGEADTPLPEAFIRRIRKIILWDWPRAEFSVSKTAITLEKIRKYQKAWNGHCTMFWAGCD